MENYYLCLLMSSVVITLFVAWLFYYSDLIILSLLAYPVSISLFLYILGCKKLAQTSLRLVKL